MKKILSVLVIISGLIYASSCSNDFDLISDWKDIPVVYALLSTTDTAHYVRVEKAFLDPETSALTLAQNPDSIYYANASVKLVDIEDNKEFLFNKVDGNLEGYQREEGVFADSPNWLFKLKTNGLDTIEPNKEYQLIVTRNETAEPVTATISTISDIRIASPLENTTISLYKQPNGGPTEPSPLNISWKFDKENTEIFDVSYSFHYDETLNGVTESKSFKVDLLNSYSPDPSDVRDKYVLETAAFYQTVASFLEQNSAVRSFRYLEIEITGAGQSFKDYLSVNSANTGLTSSQLIPNFTNFSEGYGLFASIHQINYNYFMTLQTLDSLRNGQYTKNLNFQ